jgi:thiamine biosynthesis protein ThiC
LLAVGEPTRWIYQPEKTFTKLENGSSVTRQYLLNSAYLPSFRKVNGIAEDLTWEVFRDTLIEQAEQGVSILLFTLEFHCVTFTLTAERNRNLVEVLSWPNGVCFTTKKTFYTHFEDICEIMKQYDVVFFLEMVYARSIADANDATVRTRKPR